jgi:hypothetical protein
MATPEARVTRRMVGCILSWMEIGKADCVFLSLFPVKLVPYYVDERIIE